MRLHFMAKLRRRKLWLTRSMRQRHQQKHNLCKIQCVDRRCRGMAMREKHEKHEKLLFVLLKEIKFHLETQTRARSSLAYVASNSWSEWMKVIMARNKITGFITHEKCIYRSLSTRRGRGREWDLIFHIFMVPMIVVKNRTPCMHRLDALHLPCQDDAEAQTTNK